jgi:hypothetical protein
MRNERWMELAQNYVQWRALVLALFSFLVLLPEASFVNCCYYNLSFTICIMFRLLFVSFRTLFRQVGG